LQKANYLVILELKQNMTNPGRHMANELTQLNIVQARSLLEKGEISAQDLAQAHIKASEASQLNDYVQVTQEMAMAQAKDSDERRREGKVGVMEGIPVANKDLYCVKGANTEACSNMLKDFKPQYDSTVTAKWTESGAVMIGVTNMDEFAMGSTNGNSCKGNVINPWKNQENGKDMVPGGSSGGSAAAVAAKHCMAATGSDTGGSIRQPASFCGIVGIKPTYGRCSRYGMIAFASSLDQAGVLTRSVEDAALALEGICGYDPKDSTMIHKPVPNFIKYAKGDIKGMRIGIPKEYRMDGLNEEIAKLWDQGVKWLQEQGAEIVDISLKHTMYALPTYYIIAPAEASSNLARYDGVRYGFREHKEGMTLDEMYEATRSAGFGAEVKRRIMIGTYVLSAGHYDEYHRKAQRVRRLIANDFIEAFEQVDAILTPTAPSTAFAVDEKIEDPITMYLNDVFTVPASLAGLPGISVPAGLAKNGLPLGLQLIGKAYDEATLFNVAKALENAADFNYL
jgi:aspartyl-tRNA(Asn)/glutamyl-tRNA(Gln) amidotransferase subunit A